MDFLFKALMFIVGLILIILILLQRGRGGGLAGALGGMGGQSAFGSKAGDFFTKLTSGLAIVWIILCVGAVVWFGKTRDAFDPNLGGSAEAAVTAGSEESGENDKSPAGGSKSAGKKTGTANRPRSSPSSSKPAGTGRTPAKSTPR